MRFILYMCIMILCVCVHACRLSLKHGTKQNLHRICHVHKSWNELHAARVVYIIAGLYGRTCRAEFKVHNPASYINFSGSSLYFLDNNSTCTFHFSCPCSNLIICIKLLKQCQYGKHKLPCTFSLSIIGAICMMT